MEIEGDFECVHCLFAGVVQSNTYSSRLVNNIRINEGTSTGLLAKDWDFNVQDQETRFRDDLRAASGIGKRRKKQKVCSCPYLASPATE